MTQPTSEELVHDVAGVVCAELVKRQQAKTHTGNDVKNLTVTLLNRLIIDGSQEICKGKAGFGII